MAHLGSTTAIPLTRRQLVAGLIPLAGLQSQTNADRGEVNVIPTPRFVQVLGGAIRLGPFTVVHDGSETSRLAEHLIRDATRSLSGVRMSAAARFNIYLFDWSAAEELRGKFERLLDDEDQKVLRDNRKTGQAYILRVVPDEHLLLLAGSGPIGMLYAAATIIQLFRSIGSELFIPHVHIRDYPDFLNRAAADWLIFAEQSHWAYDWGDGREAFVRRVKRKLDFCLKYKINMVVFDGFGWKTEKFPGYGLMMRELNRYARLRGIRLLYTGLGTSAEGEEHNTANVWLNRDSYPDGEAYPCMGNTFGTCRSNEGLNWLKAEEISKFVRSVEPGGLYIHHEDLQVEPGGTFERNWKKRCPRCRERWPNDEVVAPDGAAGAIAYGYRTLLSAIRPVRVRESGYDAGDCEVILVSPGYHPAPLVRDGNLYGSTTKRDWDRLFSYWGEVLRQLPHDPLLSICFRETLPQQETNIRFISAFREFMRSRQLNSRTFVFFLGGGDLYVNNYPFVAAPAMNEMFLGAESIYNFSGGHHQEPQQLLNAQFSWNASAPGVVRTTSSEEARRRYDELKWNNRVPEEMLGPGGFLDRACEKLYGAQAARLMGRFFTLYEMQPKLGEQTLVPLRLGGSERAYFPERLYPIAVLGLMLPSMDARSWDAPITDRGIRAAIESLGIDEATWQQRLAQGWAIYERVTREGSILVESALRTSGMNAGAREDLEYMVKCLTVSRLLAGLLSALHSTLPKRVRARGLSSRTDPLKDCRERMRRLTEYLQKHFTFDTVCPFGGDQGIWLDTIEKLRLKLLELESRIR